MQTTLHEYEYREPVPLWAYLVLVAALISCFIPATRNIGQEMKAAEVDRLKDVPLLTLSELERERDAVIRATSTSIGDDMYQYYVVLDKIYRFEDLQRKFLDSVAWSEVRFSPAANVISNAQWGSQWAQKMYTIVRSTDGYDKVEAGKALYIKEHGSLPGHAILTKASPAQSDNSATGSLFWTGYGWSMLFAAVFMGLRVRDKGGHVLWQLHRILPYAVVWPYKIFKYPTNLVQYEKVTKALKFAGYVLSSFLSVSMYGGMAKAAEKTKTRTADDDETVLSLDGERYAIHGFLQNYLVESDEQSYDLNVNAVRLNGRYHLDDHWSLFGEVELVNAGAPGANWLRNLDVTHSRGDTTVKVGRLVTSAGFTTPPPFLLTTVRYPWSPFASYGWGAQVEHRFGSVWSLTSDLTFSTGQQFSDSASFDGREFSSRLRWSGASANVAATVQLGGEFVRYGLDGDWQPVEDVALKGAVFGSRTETDRFLGGYGLVRWWFKRPFSSHVQLNRAPEADTVTTGFGWRTGQRGWSLTFDREEELSHGDSAWFGRLQFLF